jgi:hypothetical protein
MCYVSLFLCFSKVSRQKFSLDTFGQQADKYINRRGMFFMYLCLPMNRVNKHTDYGDGETKINCRYNFNEGIQTPFAHLDNFF